MDIDAKIKTLQKLNLGGIINDAARDKQDKILQLNQDQMFDKGVMNINKPTQKLDYAPSTVKQKKKKATFKRTDHITLRWFGDFYDRMKLIFFKNRFEITSTDLKWSNWLEPQKRFEFALGLTKQSMQKLRVILKPVIIKKINQRI